MTIPANTLTKFGEWYDTFSGKKSADQMGRLTVVRSIGFYSKTNPYYNGAYRSGGSFYSCREEKILTTSGNVIVYRPGFGSQPQYRGRFIVAATYRGTATPPAGWDSASTKAAMQTSLEARGAEAWNMLRPDMPDFSFATSVYELKDFPGMYKDLTRIVRDKVDRHQLRSGRFGRELSKSGQWYLAIQFGWVPLLSDIQNYVLAQRDAQKRLGQLIRDAGKPVRRQGNLRESGNGSANTSNAGTNYYPTHQSLHDPAFVTQCYAGPQTTRSWQNDSVSKDWAVIQFRYFLPPGPRDVVWKRNMVRRIMGSRITPRELYEIMPWSWLVDYFTGLGQFISATSGGVADRLICDYGYLMRTVTYSASVQATTSYHSSKDGKSPPLTATASYVHRCITKLRVPASPFGWGIKRESLSLNQVAILSALGLSRI